MIEDGFWLVFLFREQILVPTMARTKAGYCMGIEPKMKSISSFDKIAESWKFAKRDGAFLIVPYRTRIDKGQEEDTERGEAIPAGVPLEAAFIGWFSEPSRRKSRSVGKSEK